ncbi:histone H4-like TAF Taf6, SAGA complex subunit [Malassezia cuniculi]|uniref:TBP-associated factor 6 n=1 Tax=Malassezia cuniculi TaxID=948313 RepID=A0AAF0J7X8_9BASI|nr:histone H4-like TAF Taf6, SAGA complex subunit [Malassezia cuniculi]
MEATSQPGAKRIGASGFPNISQPPTFGSTVPMSVYPKDSVKDVAETLGIMNLRDNVAVALAADIEYRIRDIAQSANKYMRHSKRTQLTTADIDSALREKNIEPIYGFYPPYTFGKSRGPWFRSVQTPSGIPVYFMEDEELDFDSVIEQGPRVGVSSGVGWHAHWLAVEGVQPPVPENPLSLSRRLGVADVAIPDTPASEPQSDTAVKPLVKHVLSRELQLYYERLTSSIISPPTDSKHITSTDGVPMEVDGKLESYAETSSGNLVRDAALASLRGDAGIHQLVPYLIQWTGANITRMLRQGGETDEKIEPLKTVQLLHTMISTLHALLVNPAIFIEPYLHQLMPSILSVLLAAYFGPEEGNLDGVNEHVVKLRVYTATLLVHVIDNYSDYYPTLKPRVIATLLQAVAVTGGQGEKCDTTESSSSIDSKLGALIALRRLGPSSFKTLLGHIGVLPSSTDAQKDLVTELSAHGETRVPLKVLGLWLQQIKENGADASAHMSALLNSIIEEVKNGLSMLHKSEEPAEEAKTPSEPIIEHLDTVYGTFWTREVLQNDADLLMTLERYSPLATEEA